MSFSEQLSSLSRNQKLALYGQLIKAEHNRRQQPEEGSEFEAYLDDPVGFIDGVLHEYMWSMQRQICEAVRDHDRVAIKSCHESGKSWLLARIIGWWVSCHPPGDAFAVTSAPTFPQVRAILWRELNRVHAKGNLPGTMNQTEWFINKELVAFGRKPDDNSPVAFQGLHALKLLVAFDEGCGIPANLYNAAETLIANEGGKMVVIGNPDDPNTEFGNICKAGSGWHVITISAFDSPNLTGEDVPDDLRKRLISKSWVEQRKKKWGETSPLYQSKVLGEFPDVSEDSLIAPRWYTEAINRSIEPEEDDLNELGVDVARFGKNESVIYHRHGKRGRVHKTSRQRDLMHLCGLIVQAVVDTGATKIKIDDAGMGGGVTDRLNEIKREDRMSPLRYVTIVPVNVGAAATERVIERIGQRQITAKERFANLKAEITWQLRDRFEAGEIDVCDDEDTQAQATAIRYDLNSRGLITIEGKEELAERLGEIEGVTGESKSPDRFDAMVLAYADAPNSMSMQISTEVLVRSRANTGIPHVPPPKTKPAEGGPAFYVTPTILQRSRSR